MVTNEDRLLYSRSMDFQKCYFVCFQHKSNTWKDETQDDVEKAVKMDSEIPGHCILCKDDDQTPHFV